MGEPREVISGMGPMHVSFGTVPFLLNQGGQGRLVRCHTGDLFGPCLRSEPTMSHPSLFLELIRIYNEEATNLD